MKFYTVVKKIGTISIALAVLFAFAACSSAPRNNPFLVRDSQDQVFSDIHKYEDDVKLTQAQRKNKRR